MRVYYPEAGNVDNPLKNGKVRNLPCPCGSNIKIKKCCGTVYSVTPELAKDLDAFVNNAQGVDRRALAIAIQEQKKLMKEKENEDASQSNDPQSVEGHSTEK